MRFRVASIIAAAVGCILCGSDAAHGQGVEHGGSAFESLWPHDAMVPSAARGGAAPDSVCIAAAGNESVGAAATHQARPAADRGEAATESEESVVQAGPGERTRKDANLAATDGTTGDPATWPCVADILARARSYTSAKHFIVPARDNVLEAYAEALRVSSRYQEAARAGIEAIKNQYARWAAEAERQNDWSGAAAFYRKALAAIPGDDALVAALERVEDHSDESAASDRPWSTVRAQSVAAVGKRWSVQVAAVRDPAMAIAQAVHLRAAGYPAYVATFENHGAAWRRVRIGPFASRVAAGRAAARLRAREHLPGAFIISN